MATLAHRRKVSEPRPGLASHRLCVVIQRHNTSIMKRVCDIAISMARMHWHNASMECLSTDRRWSIMASTKDITLSRLNSSKPQVVTMSKASSRTTPLNPLRYVRRRSMNQQRTHTNSTKNDKVTSVMLYISRGMSLSCSSLSFCSCERYEKKRIVLTTVAAITKIPTNSPRCVLWKLISVIWLRLRFDESCMPELWPVLKRVSSSDWSISCRLSGIWCTFRSVYML